MSKKKQKRKPRTEYLYFTTDEVVDELLVTVGDDAREVTFGNKVTNVYSEVTYDRDKKPKVIARVPQGNEKARLDTQSAIANNYEFICAVDTNTRRIKGKNVSVVGVVTAKLITFPGPQRIEQQWKFDVPFGLEYVEIREKPENLGWLGALELLHTKRYITRETRVGMIVDSDLGNLRQFNERQAPVWGDVFLPASVRLIYASSDVGKSESMSNYALGLADSVSSQVLDGLERGEVPFNEKRSGSDRYEGFRKVIPTIIETGKRP